MTPKQKRAVLDHIASNAVTGALDGGEFDGCFEAPPGLDEDQESEALAAFRQEVADLARSLPSLLAT